MKETVRVVPETAAVVLRTNALCVRKGAILIPQMQQDAMLAIQS